jgi:EpsI family protein
MRTTSWQFVTVVSLLAATALASGFSQRRRPENLVHPLSDVDTHIAGWDSATGDEVLEPSVLRVLKPTDYLSRMYKKNDRKMSLFISFYAAQHAGESMHSPKHCLPGSGWEIWKHGSGKISVGGSPVEINEYSIQKSGQRMLVLYWYQSKGRIVANEYLGKIFLVRDALLENRTSGSIVRIIVPDDPASAAEGERFAAAVIPQVQRCFGD